MLDFLWTYGKLVLFFLCCVGILFAIDSERHYEYNNYQTEEAN